MPRWIEHQGKNILRMDVGGMPIDRYVQDIDEALKMVLASKPAPNSVLLVVTGDQPNGFLDDAAAAWKKFQAGADGLMRAQAVSGLSGFKRVVARLVKRDLYFASSDEDALNWLVKQ